ncbi:MAG: hypothetical protein JXA21_06210 [Anaerolineae bacterium]|nr:hypothetical protein [Anaerolineae bacterium]
MSDPIYFNGINGDTGDYGLKLDSEEAWYEQLTGHPYGESPADRADREKREKAEEDARKRLEADLARQAKQRTEALVTVLASTLAGALQPGSTRTAEEHWHALAEGVAQALLGKQYATPEHVALIQTRLQEHTAERLTGMVRMLLGSGVQLDAHELIALLLDPEDEAPDISIMLKEKLKLRANDILSRLGKAPGLLSNDRDKALAEASIADRRQWAAALVDTLRLIPVESLQALGQASGVIAEEKLRNLLPSAQKVLLDQLEKIDDPALPPFCAKLRALQENAWSDLLDTFAEMLRQLAPVETTVWRQLFAAIKKWATTLQAAISHLGLVVGINPTDVSQTGWGVIFPYKEAGDPWVSQVMAQLKPLLDWRKQQAGPLYKEYEGANGYRLQETAAKFVARYKGDVTKPVDPTAVPYYLLVVGSPEDIPFHFQYQLDIQYATGRIYFDDLEDYGRYARAVVAVEKGQVAQTPTAAFFGVANPGDPATETAARHLKQPLLEHVQEKVGAPWTFLDVANPVKAELARLMGGDQTPGFLFTSSHGMEFKPDDPEKQRARQGAILCQDWNGVRGPISEDWYFAGGDIPEDADLKGMIAFLFACYGAGTPRFDEFSKQAFKTERAVITPTPFIAALPMAMLARGALAVIAHVERAWGCSFLGENKDEQITTFKALAELLLHGHPVGWAMEYFNTHYAALSAELTLAMEADEGGGRPGYPPRPTAHELARMWTANNDARGYVVLGDPSVRLAVLKPPKTETFLVQGDEGW